MSSLQERLNLFKSNPVDKLLRKT